MWFIGGAPPRLLFFIGQLTSLLIVIYDYPAAHEPGGHTKENEQQNCSCCGEDQGASGSAEQAGQNAGGVL